MQRNWIGRSSGARVRFDLAGRDDAVEVFTTRPDTLFGASFVAIAPDHPLAAALGRENAELAAFAAECLRGGTSEAEIETQEKRGFDTGLKCRHPLDPGWLLPVYVANFVLMDYGTGAIFGCPGHDQRDLDFARRYGLPVIPVVLPPDADPERFEIGDEAYVGEGRLFRSRFLDGLDVESAKRRVIAELEALGNGTGETTWRLRDWGVSRQRYWGCPIPVIHCESCGVVPVPRAQLPVVLPEDVDFSRPGNPLERHPSWGRVACPIAGGQGGARPTPSTRSWRAPGTSPDLPTPMPSTCRSRRTRRTTGCRSTSTSAGSSTPSCICSTLASTPARWRSAATSTCPSPLPACSRRA